MTTRKVKTNESDSKETVTGSKAKSLANTISNTASKNVPDIQKYGDPDAFKLVCKASSEVEGWMKSTKAMHIGDRGCLVQVTTQQRNPDGSYVLAEALTFIPGAKVVEYAVDGKPIVIIM